jgi:hypothetical protein
MALYLEAGMKQVALLPVDESTTRMMHDLTTAQRTNYETAFFGARLAALESRTAVQGAQSIPFRRVPLLPGARNGDGEE